MTRHLIDPHVESALERLNIVLDDLAREYGLTAQDVRERLDEAWDISESWNDWVEKNW